MPFGEVILQKSLGISKTPPRFVILGNQGLLFASGNVINRVESANTAVPLVSCFLIGESRITAIAFLASDNIVAYAEESSSTIRLVEYPSGIPIESSTEGSLIVDSNDLFINDLNFSPDGQYLVALGSLPTFHVTLFQWRDKRVLSNSPNGGKAHTISFNPNNPAIFGTFGGSNLVQLWTITPAFQKCLLKISLSEHLESDEFVVFHGAWSPRGDSLFITPATGDSVYICSIGKSYSIHDCFGKSNVQDSKLKGNMLCILVTFKYVIFVGADGYLRLCTVSSEEATYDITKSLKLSSESSVDFIQISDDQESIYFMTSISNELFRINLSNEAVTKIAGNECRGIQSFDSLPLARLGVAVAQERSVIQIWDHENFKPLLSLNIPSGNVSFMCCCPFANYIAVGSDTGVLRIYAVKKTDARPEVHLVFKADTTSYPIVSILFDPSGNFIVACSQNGVVFLYDLLEDFKYLGHLFLPGRILSGMIKEDEMENSMNNSAITEDAAISNVSVSAYFLADAGTRPVYSFVHKIILPNVDRIDNFDPNSNPLPRSLVPVTTLKIDERGTSFAVSPVEFTQNKEMLFLMCGRSLKAYQVNPSNVINITYDGQAMDVISIEAPISEYKDHEQNDAKVALNFEQNWVMTWASDGLITIRALDNRDQVTKIMAHDGFEGGVLDLKVSQSNKHITTVGADGLLRHWGWNLSQLGKRLATDAAAFAEIWNQGHQEIITELLEKIEKVQANAVEDIETVSIETSTPIGDFEAVHQVYSTSQTSIMAQIDEIRSLVSMAINDNQQASEQEVISEEEFIIDLDAKRKFLQQSEDRVLELRQVIERENIKKRVLKRRIKNECWDSMEVIGQMILSFQPNSHTCLKTQVSNFPVRSRSPLEMARIQKFISFRQTQLYVEGKMAAAQSKKQTRNASVQNRTLGYPGAEGEVEDLKNIPSNVISSWPVTPEDLLLHPFELVSVERKQLQIFLLKEVNLAIKRNFNQKFKALMQIKYDEISKIEEKNERLAEILAELNINDSVFKPLWTDDELPERALTVDDDEVKIERFITAEERRKVEEKRRLDEERRLLQAKDNSKERGLFVMMNGKVDDVAEGDQKDMLIRPSCMEKAKEDLNEEDVKIIKEYEKKVATYKEEQEKAKKAIETELRKLQSSVIEICTSFDQKLLELFREKLANDHEILRNEIFIIRLKLSVNESKKYDKQEENMLQRISSLKDLKHAYVSDLPQVRRAWDQCKETQEAAVKKDRELEKSFRKDFHVFEFCFASLLSLYRKRVLNPAAAVTENSSNDVEISLDITLNSADIPEGLPLENWVEFLHARDKKIQAEKDILDAQKKSTAAHALYASMSQENEKLAVELESCYHKVAYIRDIKFHSTHDLEFMLQIKQGQLEVHQAPVVTDYTDAVWINRSVVENVNDSIVALGKSKVEALNEMKNYRKGIHALEWENKMLDFQADDLVNKIRDTQLLRLTKPMQDYLRNGENYKASTEVMALEKRAEYMVKANSHNMDVRDKQRAMITRRIKEKQVENEKLDSQLKILSSAVEERRQIHLSYTKQAKRVPGGKCSSLSEIYNRRKLLDLIKSQNQDIVILKQEVQRLRLKTYPSFAVSV